MPLVVSWIRTTGNGYPLWFGEGRRAQRAISTAKTELIITKRHRCLPRCGPRYPKPYIFRLSYIWWIFFGTVFVLRGWDTISFHFHPPFVRPGRPFIIARGNHRCRLKVLRCPLHGLNVATTREIPIGPMLPPAHQKNARRWYLPPVHAY
jgi:hypothetical protein